MYTLVVIDMQKQFMDGQKKSTIENCKTLINQAISDSAHIMFVEYDGYQQTVPELTNLVKSYNRVSHIKKYGDNGGREIYNALVEAKLPKTLKFCGVNTEFCVYASVRGYLDCATKSKVEVVLPACGSRWNHESGMTKFFSLEKENKNLTIVSM